MTDDDRTQKAMDAAIREHVAQSLGPGEIAVSHLVVVGTQGYDAEGHRHGAVLLLMSDGSMPSWEAKGLLHEGIETAQATEQEVDE